MLLPGNAVRSAYDDWSLTYDNSENRTRDLDARCIREHLGEAKFTTIVETGCGTGKNTSFLSTIADSVIAMDFSSGMLGVARERVRASNVSFTECDLKGKWPVEAGGASLVVCCLVLEHFLELEVFFSEAARVLEVGGRLLISELHPFRQYLGSQARLGDDPNAKIEAYIHNLSEYTDIAFRSGFELLRLQEAWHQDDASKPPRLLILDLIRKQN